MAWRAQGICPDAVLYIRMGKAIEAGQLQEALEQIRFNIYPVILAYLHQLGLPWETAGVAWGVTIASCTVLPLFGWARRAFSRRVAIATCVLYAIHSGLIRWSVEVIRDSTFWFLFCLSLYLLWRAVTELRWAWYVSAGAAIALACLTRFEGLVLFAPLAIWSWWQGRDGQASVRRLIPAGLVCASIYPISLMLIGSLWFHVRTADLIRTQPVALAQDWAWESVTGQRAAEQQQRPDLLAPLPKWKMAERFATGVVKGFTPLFLLALIGGIVKRPHCDRHPDRYLTGRAFGTTIPQNAPGTFSQRSHWALAYTALPILAAVWVHLYWSHEAGPRYFFPIVIMAAPLAGRGLVHVSAVLAEYVRTRRGPRWSVLAAAAPLTAMVAVNLAVAWGSDFRSRAATVELGRWVHDRYGSTARVFGPDGITQVVNHYARGRCESFSEVIPAAIVVRRVNRVKPNVILLATDRSGSWSRELSACAAALGFDAVDRTRLPGGLEKLQVLVRRAAGNDVAGSGIQSINLAEGRCAAQDARWQMPAAHGEKPRG
jgi:hypothetical protein